MNPRPQLITPACFPTPQILIRSSSGTVPFHVSRFSILQAQQTRSLYGILASQLQQAADVRRRLAVFMSAFASTEHWRYRVAAAQPHLDGRYGPVHTEQFRTPITDENVNYVPIGEPERYREGAQWDDARGRYVGGQETPASHTMRRFATLALSRFAGAADNVVNVTLLRDGRSLPGTRLLRGAEAAHACAVLATRIAARGGDASRVRATPDLVYAASAAMADRRAMFHAAMMRLAGQHGSARDAVQAWLDAAYLLYQAPRCKRGSDATIRTFLVAAGLHLLGRPPELPHDLDLLAYVHTQDDFARIVGPLIPTLA